MGASSSTTSTATDTFWLRGIEDLANLLRQRMRRERLLQKRRAFDEEHMTNGFACVAGHVQHAYRRSCADESVQQGRPFRFGHDDVTHQQMDRSGKLAGHPRGLLG